MKTQLKVMAVASLGQFLGQGLATLVGIVIPLLQLCSSPHLPSALQGLLGCISLIGIMIGSAVIGRLTDRLGYLPFFRLCPAVALVASLCAAFIPHVAVLTVSLFVMGVAVGGEYSLDPDYISELIPGKWKIFMVGVAKALASAGSAFVAVICYILLRRGAHPEIWPMLFLIVSGITALMVLLRITVCRGSQWQINPAKKKPANGSMMQFIVTHWRKVILTGVPWACEGLGVYGIGIFLPVLIEAFGLDSLPASASRMLHITNSVGLTFILCLVMMAGFGIGLSLLRRVNHLKLQTSGFWLSVVGLGILLAAYLSKWPAWIAIGCFVIFELALNAGPHLITFILPSQIFAVDERGTGSGIAAAIGKSGAVIGAFVIPVLLHHAGATGVLWVSIAVMALGAIITTMFRPKTIQN